MISEESTLVDIAYAVSTALFDVGVTAVLTGGSAATFYAPHAYQSHDLDFVITIWGDGNGSEALQSKRRVTWNEFLRSHWGAIAACDFLSVEVLALHGLVRYHVLVIIDLATRRVEIGGITYDPTGAWMMQATRNLLDAEDGFLLGKTHLIMDRDPVFTKDVRTLLRDAGVEPVRLPARSPNFRASVALAAADGATCP